MTSRDNRLAKWYFGGLASAGAACCTHPLDLLKVHLQTATTKARLSTTSGSGSASEMGLLANTRLIIRSQGVIALYNGLTASLLRQLTYSTTRFGIYEVLKQRISKNGQQISTFHSVILAGISGAAGGFIGTPADMVNVRMQNDIKLAADKRRNYRHAIDGLIKVYRYEGIKTLFNGTTMATTRAIMMTIGQLATYDKFKYLLMTNVPNIFDDNMLTHFTASTLAGAVATTFTQPLDVLKTRLMNASPNEYKSVSHCIGLLFKQSGFAGFFKGYVPAFIRLAPQTILTFVFLEQLRIKFGIRITSSSETIK
ncbi:mitochondrial dicarboxylate carrier-like [Oppia nitens]|uniref:mitochondrial dicarboxylate carrier-like n=1 Tax=Oppia nitens TaxID=1686743 RepID=UPI0023DAC77B|nr:mitochondrial dicarboxylate carrier-like [Oppia nitens]